MSDEGTALTMAASTLGMMGPVQIQQESGLDQLVQDLGHPLVQKPEQSQLLQDHRQSQLVQKDRQN